MRKYKIMEINPGVTVPEKVACATLQLLIWVVQEWMDTGSYNDANFVNFVSGGLIVWR